MSEKNKYRVRLVRWGDSSSSGRTVTFKLPDDGDEHPFKGLDVGAKNGQMLEMEIAIYDGDGDVETLGTSRKAPKPKMPRLPVVHDEPAAGGRRTATLENITRRIIKSGATSDGTSNEGAADGTGRSGGSTEQSGIAGIGGPTGGDARSKSAESGTSGTTDAEEPLSTSDMNMASTRSGDTGDGSYGPGSSDASGANLDSYANQMGQAAEALAAVAERLDDQNDDDQPQFPTLPIDDDDQTDPGVKAVRRATDLCKAIDKQRAGFYYFMRSRYPQAPKLPPEDGQWSRDAKSTRDRVCLHCEAENLARLANDPDARRKFEELETEFERHERMR